MYILAGDFNLPATDLNALTIKNTNQSPLQVSKTFLDIALDIFLQQIVEFSTVSPQVIPRTPLPLIRLKSDHDVVLLDISLQVVRAKPFECKIYLWKKTDTERITPTLSNYSKAFRAEAFSSVENMWQNLKTAITTSMEKFVPSKMSSSKHTHPWINTKIRRATRKKQRAHRKAKSTKQKKACDRYKKLQTSAHKNYIEDVVSSDMKQNPKQFWSFIKGKRHDSIGVSSLIDKDGFLHNEGPRKAEILNEQYHAADTREDTSVLQDKWKSPYPAMKRIHVHKDGVLKLLKKPQAT